MQKKNSHECHLADHLANERTFLAWMRTNFSIMALGFVIERFSFFIKEMEEMLEELPFRSEEVRAVSQKYSSALGIFLIVVGTILCVFAFYKFKRTQKQINENSYKPSLFLDMALLGLIFFGGFFFVLYLLFSLYH